jgi:hypothetical protein
MDDARSQKERDEEVLAYLTTAGNGDASETATPPFYDRNQQLPYRSLSTDNLLENGSWHRRDTALSPHRTSPFSEVSTTPCRVFYACRSFLTPKNALCLMCRRKLESMASTWPAFRCVIMIYCIKHKPCHVMLPASANCCC